MFELIDKSDIEISADILREVPDTYQKSAGFFAWDFCRAISIELKKIWDKIAYVCGFGDINNFEYDDLVKFVFQRRGIEAKEATCAYGYVTFFGKGFIERGTRILSKNAVEFETLEPIEVNESAKVKVQCLMTGVSGNIPADAIDKLSLSIPGITALTNEEPFSGGYDRESKESIIERYLDDLKKPIVSGNIYHYLKWATQCPGVGKALIKPLWNGENTVKVIISDSNSEYASSELVEYVQNYIDPFILKEDGTKEGWGTGLGQAPLGAYCTVSAGTKKPINVQAKVILEKDAQLEDAKIEIEKNIKSYLSECTFSAAYISYAKIGSCILECDFINDYSGLLVNGETQSIELTNNSQDCDIAVLETLDIKVGG